MNYSPAQAWESGQPQGLVCQGHISSSYKVLNRQLDGRNAPSASGLGCQWSSSQCCRARAAWALAGRIVSTVQTGWLNLRYHKSCIFALLRRRIVAFGARGTGHEYLFVILLVARANNILSFRCKDRPLRPRKRPQRSISRTANNILSFRCKDRPLRPRKRPQRSISRTFYAITVGYGGKARGQAWKLWRFVAEVLGLTWHLHYTRLKWHQPDTVCIRAILGPRMMAISESSCRLGSVLQVSNEV